MKVPVIRWIFEDAGTRDSPLTVAGDSSTLNPEMFDYTFVVTKPIPVHVRFGDLARPAVVPRVGRGKAKAKSLSRVSPRSEAVKGVPMGLGSRTEAQFLVRRSVLQHILRKLSRQKARQKLLEGPRPGSIRSLPIRGRAVEALKYMSRRLCPRTSVVAN